MQHQGYVSTYALDSTVQESIGHVSPEIYNAFPRKYGEQGLTAYDVRSVLAVAHEPCPP